MRRHRLLLTTLGVALALTTAVTVAVVVREARSALTDEVQAVQRLAADERAMGLSEAISGVQSRLAAMMRAPVMGDLLTSGQADALEPQLRASLEGARAHGVTISGADGEALVSVGHPVDLPPSERPEVRVGDGSAYVTVRAPVPDRDGITVGWASEEIDLRLLSQHFAQPFADSGGTTTLVDRGGNILLSSTPVDADRVQASDLLAMIRRGVEDVAVYDSPIHRTRRIGAIAPVPDTDVLVPVAADVGAAHAPADALTRRLALVLGSAVALSMVLGACGFVIVLRLRRRLERDRASADLLALTDPLTGLGNRRAFDERLDRSSGDVAVVLLDVDHLKSINDALGHAAGDAAIRSVAAAIASAVRPGDLAARIGGDEFAVVMAGGDPRLASTIAARVRTTVAASTIGDSWPLSVSTGCASGSSDRVDDVLAEADRALYEAKGHRTLV